MERYQVRKACHYCERIKRLERALLIDGVIFLCLAAFGIAWLVYNIQHITFL